MSDDVYDDLYDDLYDLDLAAVARDDDELTRRFGGQASLSWDDDVPPEPDEDVALRLLTALRADIAPRPVPDVAVVVPLSTHRRRRHLSRGAVAAAVAAGVLSLGGVAAAGVTAGPGNPLYGLHRAFFGADAVRPDPGVVAVEHLLDSADQAVTVGRLVEARALLDAAGRRLDHLSPPVASSTVLQLRARLDDVLGRLAAAEAAARPPAPAPAASGAATAADSRASEPGHAPTATTGDRTKTGSDETGGVDKADNPASDGRGTTDGTQPGDSPSGQGKAKQPAGDGSGDGQQGDEAGRGDGVDSRGRSQPETPRSVHHLAPRAEVQAPGLARHPGQPVER